jgi:hypothetical protein
MNTELWAAAGFVDTGLSFGNVETKKLGATSVRATAR